MAEITKKLEIKLEDIEGKWFINQSNFPMWLKGDKINPEFNYTIVEKKGKKCLLDVVAFEKNGKRKTIEGFDRVVNSTNTIFVWRGKGLLALIKSNWEIIHIEEEWMLIYFSKTLFTPKGYDVISRKKELSPTTNKRVNEVLNNIDKSIKLLPIKQN